MPLPNNGSKDGGIVFLEGSGGGSAVKKTPPPPPPAQQSRRTSTIVVVCLLLLLFTGVLQLWGENTTISSSSSSVEKFVQRQRLYFANYSIGGLRQAACDDDKKSSSQSDAAPREWSLEELVQAANYWKPQVSSNNNSTNIPKLIHLIWMFPTSSTTHSTNFTTPKYLQRSLATLKELHPDYRVILWSNANIIESFPEMRHLLDGYLLQQKKYLSWAADIIRYMILLKYGGIYMDTDLIPLRRYEPLRAGIPEGFTACVEPNVAPPPSTTANQSTAPRDYIIRPAPSSQTCHNINNAFIGSPPGNVVLFHAISTAIVNSYNSLHVVKNDEHARVPFLSGPAVWRDSCRLFNFFVLYGHTVYPCPVNNRGRCNPDDYRHLPYAFAMHKWQGSWETKALPEED